MTTLNRRELLQRIAYLMGGAIAAPTLAGLLSGCAAAPSATAQPRALSQAQFDLMAEVAETMLPRTDSPGAKDVGAPAFIDSMLQDVYPAADRKLYLRGLDEFAAVAEHEYGKGFVALDARARLRLVQHAHDDALVAERARPFRFAATDRPFILATKELALLAFFTSEAGATQVLQYDRIPGAYHGCVPLPSAGNGKAWAMDASSPF